LRELLEPFLGIVMPIVTPPIALTSLSIRNFRGIEDLSLEFVGPDGLPNQLVVLAGPNGCGKTAVLEAALMAIGGQSRAVGPIGSRAIRKGATDYEIRVTSQNASEPFLPNGETTLKSRSRDLELKVPHWYFSSWRAPALVGAVDVTVGKGGRRPAKTDANRLLNVKQQLANTAAMESFRGTGRASLPRYTSWINSINEGWRKFYLDRDDEFAVELTEENEEASGAFEVYYLRKGEPRLSVDHLSAGQLELFLFLSALVLNDDREGIVLIDEPELHLDPQWHTTVLRTLMRLQPKAQFIVATHSPQIYESAMSYERHFLVPADDQRASIWGHALGRG
jgi:predicted ATPase